MKTENYNIIENKLLELQSIGEHFGVPTLSFEEVYLNSIRSIAESPYMFNYFHWITNIKEMKIIHSAGIKKVLGYDETSFDIRKGLSIIHPNFLLFVLEYSIKTYQMLAEKKYQSLSGKVHYSIQFPILRSDGEFIVVQMNVSIILVDKDGNPLVHYNRFEVLGNYWGEPLVIKPKIYFKTEVDLTTKAKEAENEISANVRDFILQHLNFTDREKSVLQCLSNGDKLNDISEILNIKSVETVKKHNLNILRKARLRLSPSFLSARDVAMYLKSMSVM